MLAFMKFLKKLRQNELCRLLDQFSIYFANVFPQKNDKSASIIRGSQNQKNKPGRSGKSKTKPNVYSKSNPELLLKLTERAAICNVFPPSGPRWKSNWKHFRKGSKTQTSFSVRLPDERDLNKHLIMWMLAQAKLNLKGLPVLII